MIGTVCSWWEGRTGTRVETGQHLLILTSNFNIFISCQVIKSCRSMSITIARKMYGLFIILFYLYKNTTAEPNCKRRIVYLVIILEENQYINLNVLIIKSRDSWMYWLWLMACCGVSVKGRLPRRWLAPLKIPSILTFNVLYSNIKAQILRYVEFYQRWQKM